PWPRAFARAVGVVLKDQDDLDYIAPRLDAILAESAA
ncbi:MAG: MoxR family ATPase, partial [Rhodobacteraceae bacterium]